MFPAFINLGLFVAATGVWTVSFVIITPITLCPPLIIKFPSFFNVAPLFGVSLPLSCRRIPIKIEFEFVE